MLFSMCIVLQKCEDVVHTAAHLDLFSHTPHGQLSDPHTYLILPFNNSIKFPSKKCSVTYSTIPFQWI